jgi:hypothetical protein
MSARLAKKAALLAVSAGSRMYNTVVDHQCAAMARQSKVTHSLCVARNGTAQNDGMLHGKRGTITTECVDTHIVMILLTAYSSTRCRSLYFCCDCVCDNDSIATTLLGSCRCCSSLTPLTGPDTGLLPLLPLLLLLLPPPLARLLAWGLAGRPNAWWGCLAAAPAAVIELPALSRMEGEGGRLDGDPCDTPCLLCCCRS